MLRTVTLVLLCLDFAWYAVLVVCEVRRPRPHYDIRRWSTVFPLGMTAVATLSTATAADLPGLHTPGSALLWVAAAVWLLALAGVLRARDVVAVRPGGRRGPIGGDRRSG